MYIYEATYYNEITNKNITRTIEFDGSILDNGKDCYLYATNKAFDIKEPDEHLAQVTLVSC